MQQGENIQQEVPQVSLKVDHAELTTPYTWKVYLHNVSEKTITLNNLKAYLMADGKTCGVSKGFIADKNVIDPGEVVEVIFYGFNDCGVGVDYMLKFTANGITYTINVKMVRPLLWLSFADIKLDKANNKIMYLVESKIAEFNGYADGDANGFSWIDDIVSGIRGEALDFSDGNKKIITGEMPLPPSPEESNYVTVSFWMHWDGTFKVMPFGWDTAYDLYLNSAGHLCFNTGVGDCYGVPSPDIANKWVHIVAVFPVESNYEKYPPKLYINGEQQSLSYLNDIQPTLRNVTSRAHISGWGSPNDYYLFKGMIDEVRIYNRELSQEEVKKLYLGEDERNGLILYYSFDKVTIDTDNNLVYDLHNWVNENGVYLSKNDYIRLPVTVGDINNRSFTFVVRIIPFEKPLTQKLIFSDAGDEVGFAISGGYYVAKLPGASVQANNEVVEGEEALLIGVYEYNSETSTYKVKFYLNGELVGESAPVSNSFITADNPADPLVVGTDPYDYDPPAINGIVKEVRVYLRSLSDAEVSCIYNNSSCLLIDPYLAFITTFANPYFVWDGFEFKYDWHRSTGFPLLREDNVGAYLDANGDTIIAIPSFSLYGKKAYTEIIVARQKDLNTTTDPTKVVEQGIKSINTDARLYLEYKDDATTPDYFNTVISYSDLISYVGEVNYQETATANELHAFVTQWLGNERNVVIVLDGEVKVNQRIPEGNYTIFEVDPTHVGFGEALTTKLVASGAISTEKAHADIYLVLAVEKVLTIDELKALCLLFGTC